MIYQHRQHNTAIGTIHSWWTSLGLHSLAIGDDDSRRPESLNQRQSTAASLFDEDVVDQFDHRLCDYCVTGSEAFSDLTIDPTGWTEFSTRIYQCCREIPPGQTMTYKQLAAAAGNEKASRAVGAAMARNRILLVIPCHRVIAASGQLRGFSAPGGLVTKQALLDLEQNAVCG